MAWEDIVRENIKLTRKIRTNYTNELLPEVEKEILKEVEKLLRTFNLSKGKFVTNNTENINDLKKINTAIKRILESTQYTDNTLLFLDNLTEIDENIKAIHEDLNNIIVGTRLINSVKTLFIADTTEDLLKQGVNANFVNPITRALRSRVQFGASLQDTLEEISAAIIGDGEGVGSLCRYVQQVTFDAVNQYKGRQHAAIKDKFKLDGIYYVGDVKETTRGQCVRWVKKRLLKVSTLTREINHAYENEGKFVDDNAKFVTPKKGKKKDFHRYGGMIGSSKSDILTTDKTNFIVYRGGYRCEHEAIPTKLV